ncbi:hypothetical protein B0I37DRAFT_43481 [Chaetomium sp. MPI-CAGE-AT-0009]|nr:hypothetical protein B0I37DRAFT_43481 [Chaetomium sp. MPI-CAGE-AT-0009]
MRDLPCADRRIPQTLFPPLEIALGCIGVWVGTSPLLTTSDRANWGVLLPVQEAKAATKELRLHHRSVSREIGTFEALVRECSRDGGGCANNPAPLATTALVARPWARHGGQRRGGVAMCSGDTSAGWRNCNRFSRVTFFLKVRMHGTPPTLLTTAVAFQSVGTRQGEEDDGGGDAGSIVATRGMSEKGR